LGVEAPALLQHADAFELQRANPLFFVRRHFARHVRELTLAAEALRDRLALGAIALIQRAAQRRRRSIGIVDL